jgi:hypothetical protein
MIGGARGPLPQNLCRRHGARTCSIRRERARLTARVNERLFRQEQPLGVVQKINGILLYPLDAVGNSLTPGRSRIGFLSRR